MVNLNLDYIVDEVVKRLQIDEDEGILVESSGRHVHLSSEHVEQLFGKGYQLVKKRNLSQFGQYLCEEKVALIGPKSILNNVSVLGPIRDFSQVEISKTDAVSIGINAPVKISGSIENSGKIIVATSMAAVTLKKGLIVAKRHIHLTPGDALKYVVKDNEAVSIDIGGERGVVLKNVIVRVSDKFSSAVHLDYDEANACGFYKGMRAKIVR